jgi:hypothetical protein
VQPDVGSYFEHASFALRTAMKKMIECQSTVHVYEVRPRKDKRGVDLISDVLSFGRLFYGEPNAASNAIGYAMHRSRPHDAVIRAYDSAGNVIETHEQEGDFKEP